jgi:predicted DNA-binding transcriptional regulator YafY
MMNIVLPLLHWKAVGFIMSDETSLHRQWILLKLLSSRRNGVSVREMAGEMGVNDKTIRRDLDAFRALGFPLEQTLGEFGRKIWRIEPSGNQPILSFRFDEAVALFLGRRLLDPLAGTLFWEAAQSAFRKIRASLGESTLKSLDKFKGAFHHKVFGSHDYSKKSELIDLLQVAIEDSKAVHILYQSERATEPAYRDVYPYGLIYHQHRSSLYLVALDPQEDKVKNYKVDRIEAVEISPFPFQRPPAFEAAAHLAATFGVYVCDGEAVTIKVRFVPGVVRYVQESQWHASQKFTNQPDGSLVAEFQLSSTEEFTSWLLSFGSKAVVLEPEWLRAEIGTELRTLLAAYESVDSSPNRRVRMGASPSAKA